MSSRTQDASQFRCEVVVPIRSFSGSKHRLATVLNEAERELLVERLASRVLSVCSSYPTIVVTSDPDVERFATQFGSAIVADPGSLNAAADAGREFARRRGADRVVILHADLAHIVGIEAIATCRDPGTVVAVADQRRDGTPAISVPTGAEFEFSYGPGSFARHRKNALDAGLHFEVLLDDSLGFDIDLPEDLVAMLAKEQSS